MRIKLKDFVLPERWHVKIHPNNYKVLNNWRKSNPLVAIEISIERYYYINQDGYASNYKPASTLITFPQFRKYVYPNIIPPIEKRVVEVTQEKDFDVDKWFMQRAGYGDKPKEKPEQYGFYIGNHLNGSIFNNEKEAQEALQETLEKISFTQGSIFKVLKTITKKTTYEID